jgi:GrpB-like predicted nucleotidyltransferase (UPF0157 family)
MEAKKQDHPVRVVDYNPLWPVMYEQERRLIQEAIGQRILAIEHVGSTSVRGLAAKPTIDIMIGVGQLADAVDCLAPLESLGYGYVPEYEEALPCRRYFHKGPSGARTHHMHMVELAGDFWREHILFRDYLRAHAETAQAYERLKRELAARFSEERSRYTEAKAPFVKSVVQKAQEAKATNL